MHYGACVSLITVTLNQTPNGYEITDAYQF